MPGPAILAIDLGTGGAKVALVTVPVGPDYRVMDLMSQRGWNLNGLHKPASLHICVTLRHTQPGVAARFVTDLKAAVEQAKRSPADEGGQAPLYGLAASFPLRCVVADLLTRYMDILYKV